MNHPAPGAALDSNRPDDPAWFRHVLGHYPTGVTVATAMTSGNAPVGMVIGSFTSVSLDPPLVAFLPGRSSTTWPQIMASGAFCVNVLSAGQQGAVAGGCGRADDCRGRRHDDAAPAINGVIKRFTDPVLKTGVAQGSWQFMGQYPAGRWCLGGSGHAHSSLRRCGSDLGAYRTSVPAIGRDHCQSGH